MDPRAVGQCTLCSTKFKFLEVEPSNKQSSWKATLAWDIVWYVCKFLACVIAVVTVVGFIVRTKGFVLHSNPVINHLLTGSTFSLSGIGISFLLYVLWQLPACTGQFFGDVSRSFDGGWDGDSSGSDSIKALVALLIFVGVCVVLWFFLKGLYQIVCEASQCISHAMCAANARTRRRVVQERIVLDLDEEHIDGVLR